MSVPSSIAIIRYRGALSSAVFGMEEMLRFAGTLDKDHPLTVSIIDDFTSGFDAYILPPAALDIDFETNHRLPQQLKQEHERGAIMCSVCAGLIWLAEAGILGKRRVTTHWDLETQMAHRYPDVLTDVNQILIEHADLTTAGGMMAWVDLSMALIERLIGRDVMIETSRRFVVDIGRRDQRRYRRFTPNLTHHDTAVRKAQLSIESNFASHISLIDLAEIAGLAERTFIRRFTTVTGKPPMTYVQVIRIEKAKDMLIHSTLPVQQIAFAAGYSDHSSFGRKFVLSTGMTPRDFRRRFAN